MIRKCQSCYAYDPNRKKCQFNINIDFKFEPTDFCSKHLNNLYVCGKCGATMIKPIIENNKPICGNRSCNGTVRPLAINVNELLPQGENNNV